MDLSQLPQVVANICLDSAIFLWVAFIAYLIQQALNKRHLPSNSEGKESK